MAEIAEVARKHARQILLGISHEAPVAAQATSEEARLIGAPMMDLGSVYK